METPFQQVGRLLGALDEMDELEGMYLRGGYYDLAVDVRTRSEPVVQKISALADQPGVADYRSRIEGLVARSVGHAEFLQKKMEEMSSEIKQIQQNRFRSAQVLPAYGGRSPFLANPRFQAAG